MATKKQDAAGLPVQRLIPVIVVFPTEGDDATIPPGPVVPLDFSQELDFSDPSNSDLLPII